MALSCLTNIGISQTWICSVGGDLQWEGVNKIHSKFVQSTKKERKL